MQGSEYKIILFCATHRNPTRQIVFSDDDKRLHLYASRARNVNFIIADQRMLSEHPTPRSTYDACARCKYDTNPTTVIPYRYRTPGGLPNMIHVADTSCKLPCSVSKAVLMNLLLRSGVLLHLSTLQRNTEKWKSDDDDDGGRGSGG